MVLGIDPKVDYAFKRVFGDERNSEILIHLVNAILKPESPIVRIQILNPFQHKDIAEGKLTVLDIRARDQSGRLLNVELQLLLPPYFRERLLFYWAGLYRRQLQENEPYDELRPAISIGILNQVLFPDVGAFHLEFGLYNREHGLRFTDHIELHLLELPKFQCEVDLLQDPLDKWLYFFRHAERMDPERLPESFQEPVFRHAVEELKMLTQDELERERYESREKAMRDQISLLRAVQKADEARVVAREEGLEEGRAKGLAKGLAEGLAEGRADGHAKGSYLGEYIGRIHLCERRLGRNLTPTDQLMALPIETLDQRAGELEKELFGS